MELSDLDECLSFDVSLINHQMKLKSIFSLKRFRSIRKHQIQLQSLPRDLLDLVAVHLLTDEYLRLRQTCSALHALAVCRTLPWMQFHSLRICPDIRGSGHDLRRHVKLSHLDFNDQSAKFLVLDQQTDEFIRLLMCMEDRMSIKGRSEIAMQILVNAKALPKSNVWPNMFRALLETDPSRISSNHLYSDASSEFACLPLVQTLQLAFEWSVFWGDLAIVKLLSTDHRTRFSSFDFLMALDGDHFDIAALLVNCGEIDPCDLSIAVEPALQSNWELLVSLIPKIPQIMVSSVEYRLAVRKQDIATMRKLSERVDASQFGNEALQYAIKYQNVDMLRCLVDSSSFDCSALDNAALDLAAEVGNVSILQKIALAQNVQLTQAALYAAHMEVISLLLDSFQDCNAEFISNVLMRSVETNRLDICKLIISKYKFQQQYTHTFDRMLDLACANSLPEIVNFLVSNSLADPSKSHNACLCVATLNSNYAIIHALTASTIVFDACVDLRRFKNGKQVCMRHSFAIE